MNSTKSERFSSSSTGGSSSFFTRPPLAHVVTDDGFPHYCEAYSTLTPIFNDYPLWMLEAIEDAVRDARLRREVIG